MNVNPQYGVQIPGGLWRDGVCVHDVWLRSLSGEDEAFLLEGGEALSGPARTTALLSRCVLRIGSDANITRDKIRALTVGDREALLLHLRRVTYGDRLPCLLNCANRTCGERLDLELKAGDLLVAADGSSGEWSEFSVRSGATTYRVRMRVPNGLDQELLAEGVWPEAASAEDFLLRRCVESVVAEDGATVTAERWLAELAEEVSRRMNALDPQAEILLSLQCPACGLEFSGEFDAGAYLFEELRGHTPYLYREVHRMACAYHWSEAEILSMTPRKRSVYLGLLAGEDVLA